MPRLCLAIVAVIGLIVAWLPVPVAAQANFDRPGADYSRTPVLSGDPADCALLCERDRRCRAWSFNYPTDSSGGGAVCWLKNAVPPRVENPCCVSGVRGAGVMERFTNNAEMSTDRTGGDYLNFEIKPADRERHEEVCRDACEGDTKCRAWTYVRPGYIGGAPRCYLKKEIKAPRRKPCCVSGVVR